MRALVVVFSFFLLLALIHAKDGDKCTALTRQDTCGSLSYCCTTTKKVDDCLVPGDCEGRCSEVPCANTTETPFALCSGDGTNATAWNSQVDYSIPCDTCPFSCWGNQGECYDEPTCAAILAVATWLVGWVIAVFCVVGFFLCVLPICAVCICGVTVCGFGLASAQNRHRQPVTTTVTHVGYVAAPAGHVPQPGHQQPVVTQGYAQPYPPTSGYPQHQPPPAYQQPQYQQAGPYKV